jgi:competence ComEA-like helix-hairpin-helix protein
MRISSAFSRWRYPLSPPRWLKRNLPPTRSTSTPPTPPTSSRSGIGPSTAQKILDTRKSCGSFKSVDDLLAIKGIGPKKLEKMRKVLTVGKPPSRKQSNTP